MNIELQKKLFTEFPVLYGQKDLGLRETCMCWGIECGDGWFNILYDLSKKLAEIDPGLEAVQVKEKFGGLRFYTGPVLSCVKDDVYKAIDEAEELSYKTCEICGCTENVTQTEGWIISLCPECMKKRNKK